MHLIKKSTSQGLKYISIEQFAGVFHNRGSQLRVTPHGNGLRQAGRVQGSMPRNANPKLRRKPKRQLSRTSWGWEECAEVAAVQVDVPIHP